jgi:Fe-S oxidoreductase
MPVSNWLSSILSGNNPTLAYNTYWWLHAIALLAFILVLIPFTKHLHVFTAIANCFLHRDGKPNTQRRETFAAGNQFGAGRVDELSDRDLIDSFACTSCGRCQNACPAHKTGKPLNPRLLIKTIQANLLANGPALRSGQDLPVNLLDGACKGSMDENSIWSCTSCGACMEACPVFIEHLPKLVDMRRHLVQMQAKFPEELLNLFENMEQRSNPWGIAPGERGKWATLLGDRSFKPGETEYLFFVGCAGAFDNRSKQVTVALTTILDQAGVSWGILGKDEPCCGDSLRRLGNEYVFDKIAKANVAMLKEKGVVKVITQCPHCFTTLANDYKQYDIKLQVIHHSQLIDELIGSGRLKLPKSADLGRTIFHDSCYLGRHNDIYDQPRRVLQAATGSTPAEFPRHGDNSFCCGAGGGRMWMEEHTGSRINIDRVKEGLEQKPDTICVSCPYCMTMLEDGLKDEDQADNVKVKDIAEVVAEALRPSA